MLPSRGPAFSPRELRVAAIDACVIHAVVLRSQQGRALQFDAQAWPNSIWHCERDLDAHDVRRAFGQWIALSGSPDAIRILKKQLKDINDNVRKSALLSLGIVGGPLAREVVEKRADPATGDLKLPAVEALANWGAGALLRHARDESTAVRLIVAEELHHFPQLDSAIALQNLLTDQRNLQVQLKAVAALDGWPRELAVPILIHGLREGLPGTRQACSRRLGEYVDLARPFDYEAKRSERIAGILELARQHNLRTSLLGALERESFERSHALDEDRVREIGDLLQEILDERDRPAIVRLSVRRLREQFADVPPGERTVNVSIIERFLSEKESSSRRPSSSTPAPRVVSLDEKQGMEAIYRDVLPEFSAGYRAALDLEDDRQQVARRGATDLVRFASSSALTPQLLRRVHLAIGRKTDRMVWQSVLTAIGNNGSEEAAELARGSLGHFDAQLRTRACNYFERYARPGYGLWLLGALNDRHVGVQIAAIRAVGKCGDPRVLTGIPSSATNTQEPGAFPVQSLNQGGLRALRRHRDAQVRFEVAVAMSRLGDEEGMAELKRLAFGSDVQNRRRAVDEMAASGRTWFVGPLIQLAWAQLDDRDDVLRMRILNALERLVDRSQHPAETAPGFDHALRIRAWNEWWNARRGVRGEGTRYLTTRSKGV